MPTYRCVIEYDGTEFSGWQYQHDERTVCNEVEVALSALFAEPVNVTAAGRTDAGVHASGQVISFFAERVFPIDRLALALNTYLPPDVTARDASFVTDGFSARHHALSRTYEYLILNRPLPSAAMRRFAHHVYKPIDAELFASAAAAMIGEHDFIAFCGVLPEKGGTVRTVHSIELERADELVRIRIKGAGFLHRMVRISVGTLVEIATGRRVPGDIPRIIASKDRRQAGYTAPACGLFFTAADYGDGFTSYRPALGTTFAAAPPPPESP